MEAINRVMTIMVGLALAIVLTWKGCTYTSSKGQARPT